MKIEQKLKRISPTVFISNIKIRINADKNSEFNGKSKYSKAEVQSYGVVEAHTSRLIREFAKKIQKEG